MLDFGWTARSLTAFADDFHTGEHLRKVTDLDRSLWRFGCFLDQLLDAHLLVNARKSAALLRLTKGFAPSWVKSHIRKGPDGHFLHFCTPAGRPFDIRLKTEHVYLGLTISYHKAVSLSVAHRIDAAWGSWAKLRPMLTSAFAPALDLRLRLWRACIPPTLLYGLHVLPLTAKLLGRLQAVYTRHLRAVSKFQAHLTFDSMAAVHERLRVPTVKDILLNALEGLCLRVDIAVEAGLEGADMPQYCLGLSQSLLGISDPSQSSSAYGAPCSSSLLHGHVPTDMGATQVQCPDCSSVFPDLRTLRVHQASHHKVTVATRNIGVPFDALQHARAGMPICALCDKVFSRWSVLRNHIQKGRCALLDPQLALSLPPSEVVHPPCPLTPTKHFIKLTVSEQVIPAPSEISSGSAGGLPRIPPAMLSLALHVPGSGSRDQARQPRWKMQVGQLSSTLSLARDRGWQQLITMPGLRDELRHHCPCCGQWCATPAGMKIHLVNSHDCWTDLWPRVLELAALMHRAITKPCIYCLESTFDKQSHWKRCHVITLSCFIEYSRRNDACSVQSHAAPGTPIADGPGARDGHVPTPCLCLSSSLSVASVRHRSLHQTTTPRTDVDSSGGRHHAASGWNSASVGIGEGQGEAEGQREKAKERTRARAEASQSRGILSEATVARRANCLRRDGSRRLRASACPPILGQMARLVLRHEQQLQAVQRDTKLHLRGRFFHS